MKARFSYLIVFLIAVCFTACKKTNKQGRLIPADAAFVMHIDGKSLLSKLPWSEIKSNELFQAAYSDSSMQSTIKKLLDDPEKSGIDINNDILIFIKKDTTGGYVAIEGSVKDAAALKTFNTEITEGGSEGETDGVHYISKAPLCASWNNEKFVYIIDAPGMKQIDALSSRMKHDSIDVPAAMPRDLTATCKSIFALSDGNTLAKDEKFTKLMAQSGDIKGWINSESLTGDLGMLTMLANLDKLYKGNITTFAASFDNGKITMNGHSYAGEDLGKLYKKYGGGKVSEDMIKRIPGKEMIFVAGLNFKPEGVKEFLKMLGVDGLFNTQVGKQLGFTLDDFVKANKGDIVVGLSDFHLTTDTTPTVLQPDLPPAAISKKPEFNFVFAASIGDKDAFNKLINAGKKVGSEMPQQNSFGYNSNGEYFVLSNTKDNADKYLASTNSGDIASKISGQAFGGFVNIQAAMKSFGTEVSRDSLDKAMFDENLKFWDNAIWKGGDIDDGAIVQSVEINLMDKSTNSLKQFNQFTSKLGGLLKEKKKKEKENMMAYEDAANMVDTIAVPKMKSNK